MKTINISPRAKTVTQLLKQAKDDGLILRTSEGKYYILAALEGWEGFDVGNGQDFGKEVKATIRNKELMRFLEQRSGQSRRTSLARVKQQLGLD